MPGRDLINNDWPRIRRAVLEAQEWAEASEAIQVDRWQGPWTLAAEYIVLHEVSRNGSSWICIQAHTATNDNAPGEAGGAAFWNQIAAKGDTGAKPAHDWDSTSLRLENPDGSWGDYVDLKGEKGDPGAIYTINDIGTPGSQGFGVGVAPETPSDFSLMTETLNPAGATYGNYQYADGSVMVWIPRFYYRIGHADNPTYAAHGVNSIDVKGEHDFSSRASAEAAGYALHRCFVDGGQVKRGLMVDKYQCSRAAWGSGWIASSIKNGLPISTHSTHNPIAGLTACATNTYYEAITAPKARDGVNGAVNASSIFFCCSRFIHSALAILSMAHGQAAQSAAHCAWYDAAGVTNFPKGNNNSAYGDINDGDVLYESDGFGSGTSGKTGSGAPLAKTTHNGQESGVADLNGNMWEIAPGLTRPGTSGTDTTQQNDTAAFYALKESVEIRTLTSGWNTGTDAWGDATHLATLYDPITLAHIANGVGWRAWGNGANQVLSEAIAGDGWLLTGLAIYKDANAESADGVGTNLFGKDGLYEYHRANLTVLSGGSWASGVRAGVWVCYLYDYRSNSSTNVGFRAACYPL